MHKDDSSTHHPLAKAWAQRIHVGDLSVISGQRFIVGVWACYILLFATPNESRQRFEIHPFDGHSNHFHWVAAVLVFAQLLAVDSMVYHFCAKGPDIEPFWGG
ncbi:hypothetical protein DMENIID0001_012040 [Sergentomyia squamirostris]